MSFHRLFGLLGLLTLPAICLGCRSGVATAPPIKQPSTLALEKTAKARPLKSPPSSEADKSQTVLVTHLQEVEDLPEVPLPKKNSPEEVDAVSPLELSVVIHSVQQTYPPLLATFLERDVQSGQQLNAWGAFDLTLKAFGIAAPEGFYETYRNGVALEQPVFSGGYLFGGYRIGDGNFQPWYGERETNEGGEFSAGFGVPLLKDRAIDKRRAKVFQAELARRAVEPIVQTQFLEFVRLSSRTYWTWVASGQALEAQRELMELARARVSQIRERVDAGDLPIIARINNEQLIAARETKVIESERKLQQSAIKLSLFFRNVQGKPIVPDESRLPESFPKHVLPETENINQDIFRAVAARPELIELDLVVEQIEVELGQARNTLLPKLDARLYASKDVGAPASAKGDKTPFEMEVGLYGELPLQRRGARGKIQAAQAKIAQIETKRQFVVNKVAALVQDAVSALEAAAGRIERAQTNLRLARETLDLGRQQFEAGDIDLIALNIYEQAATDARLQLIFAQADFFAALADYRAALSLDPLKTDD